MNTTTQIFYNYKIETGQSEHPYVRVYNLRAKKEWKSLVYNFRFTTSLSRDMWLTNFKETIAKREGYKAERKAERKAFVNPARVGDILYSSWGYEQTNIDFYQVISVKGKQIVIQELCQDSNQTEYMQGKCLPIPFRFKKDSEPMTKIVQPGYSVSLTSYSSAWLWDGRPMHYTQYA